MKKQSQKKLQLGRIKVASLNTVKVDAQALTAGTCTILCSTVCRANTSMGAPVCSDDSCRF
ncbi:hypothetical protein [Chitinophaga sp. Cy-1792]|uniref:hypothetical protein n=1 Tax=Chitinophaga sp. Cy-1792 TaxID=2608339 RepID=UPI00141E95D2|nr:hypothetical protein [Chitinophaga sp. Cy-1792]NIG55616.1 hypothetical protein [Chitinophaga sp. Cy-1792]